MCRKKSRRSDSRNDVQQKNVDGAAAVVCAGKKFRGYENLQYVLERSSEDVRVGGMCIRGILKI